jgi:ribosomal protein L14E/L6E/L27E
MKPGRIVILLAGRHAGKKAIIVKQHDDGKKVRISSPHQGSPK